MAVSEDDVRRIARLARIDVPEDDVASLSSELSSILGWVEQLAEADVDGVVPMASAADLTLPLRDDEATSGTRREDILANAPDARDGYFAVPKVIE